MREKEEREPLAGRKRKRKVLPSPKTSKRKTTLSGVPAYTRFPVRTREECISTYSHKRKREEDSLFNGKNIQIVSFKKQKIQRKRIKRRFGSHQSSRPSVSVVSEADEICDGTGFPFQVQGAQSSYWTRAVDDLGDHVSTPVANLEGEYQVDFSHVAKLRVKRMPQIGRLWDLMTAREFSSMFPDLRSLSLEYMRNLKYIWNEKISKESHSFTNLSEITVESCNSLKSIYQQPSTANTIDVVDIEFSKLQTLRLKSLKSFNYFLQGNVNLNFVALEELELIELKSMKTFADPGNFERRRTGGGETLDEDYDSPSLPLFYRKALFRKLEKMQLQGLQSVDKLWGTTTSREFTLAFPTLQVLNVANLPQITNIWSNEHIEESICFQNLVNIAIRSCKNLECLFSLSSSYQQLLSPPMISFPKLERLELIGLMNLGSVFRGSLNMAFPALKVLIVRKLHAFKILIRQEKPESLDEEETHSEAESDDEKESTKKGDGPGSEDSSDEDGVPERYNEIIEEKEYFEPGTILFNGNVEFPSLEELRIEFMPRLEQIYDPKATDSFAANYLFPRLKTLHLTGGKGAKLKQLPKKILRRLTSLRISKLHRFKCLVSSSQASTDEALFGSVSKLKKLEQLTVEDCDAMKSIVSEGVIEEEDDRELLFPYLRKINLYNLRSLYTFIKSTRTIKFPTLESLDMGACPGIQSFSSTPLEAPKLNKVAVDRELIPMDDDLNLNTILGRKFDPITEVAKDMPSTST